MSNPKQEYNDFIRANLPGSIRYDSVRNRYVTANGKYFVTYKEAKWYVDYLVKRGSILGYSEQAIIPKLVIDAAEAKYFQESAPVENLTDIVTHSRASGATYLDSTGTLQTAASGEIRDQAYTYVDGVLTGPYLQLESASATNLLLNSDNLESQTVQLTPGEDYTLSFTSGNSVVDIDASIAATAVDVFVYDTSKDSDGGAWATSYPAQMVIVAEAASVKIYDGTDPALPLHTTLDFTGYTVTSLAAVSGVLSVGTTTGVAAFNLADGDITVALDYTTATTPAIVNNTVNDVAMTVLPDAPIDPATGLPVPTIAVATAGGVSVITDSGAVYDSAWTLTFGRVSFDGQGGVWAARSTSTYILIYGSVSDYISGDGWGDTVARGDTSTAGGFDLLSNGISGVLVADNTLALSGNASVQNSKAGVSLRQLDYADQSKGMSALLTSTYNTGWMNGDIKGAFLADTDDTDLVGGTDNDRSVNNNPLTVNGTVTRSPVATGAELVAYSGFSTSNYLEQPYNSALDFGTGDFCVMGWAKTTDGYATFLRLGDASGNPKIFVGTYPEPTAGNLEAYILGSGYLRPSVLIPSGWFHWALVRENGQATLYANASPLTSVASSGDLSLSGTETLRIGVRQDGAQSLDRPSGIALLRISATAPTADQILKIYNDEKVLFQDNAACTLYGASDAVTALAHDPDTDLLHVGTSAGRSVFYGLRRLNNTTTPVTTAISAANGIIGEQ